jgi:hypothetical protein
LILEVAYQMPRPGLDFLTNQLKPPVLLGQSGWASIRWNVSGSANLLAMETEWGAGADVNWMFRGGLWAPEPKESSLDLEQWFLGRELNSEEQGESRATSSLQFWRTDFAPVRVLGVSRLAWLLACSLCVLVLGLALSSRLTSKRFVLPAAILVATALCVSALAWPGIGAGLAYGSEPGFAVLFLVLLIKWSFFSGARRNERFIAGFANPRNSSSIARKPLGSGVRPKGEPSTVDVIGQAIESSQSQSADFQGSSKT